MFQQLLTTLARALEGRKIPYMLIGGQAVLLYGEPRLTQDVDVTLGIETDRLDEVLDIIQQLGWSVLVEDVRAFVKKTLVLPCQNEAGIRIDFIFSFSPYERQAIQRAKRVTLGGTGVVFAAVEDLIIHKIVAGRPRDLEDVAGILLKNPEMDQAYIQDWLRQFEEALQIPLVVRFDHILEEGRHG